MFCLKRNFEVRFRASTDGAPLPFPREGEVTWRASRERGKSCGALPERGGRHVIPFSREGGDRDPLKSVANSKFARASFFVNARGQK